MDTNAQHAGRAYRDEARDHLRKALRATLGHWLSPEAERELRAAARAGVKAAQAHLAELDRELAEAPAGPAAPPAAQAASPAAPAAG